MYKYIDTHSHLNFPAYDEDREKVIKRMKGVGVASIVVGTITKNSTSAVKLAQKYDFLWAAVGVHPGHANDERYFDENELREKPEGVELFDEDTFRKFLDDPKVVALGECGLDYFHKPYNAEAQKELFKKHLNLATEMKKPVIIHCRDPRPSEKSGASAHDDVLEILEDYKGKVKGVVHFFSGTYEQAKRYVGLGFSLSFTGAITFGSNYDDIIRSLPLEHIMIETDCPYVSPVPYRGKRNEPTYVIEVAKKIAKIKDMTLEEVATETTKNAQKLFNLTIS